MPTAAEARAELERRRAARAGQATPQSQSAAVTPEQARAELARRRGAHAPQAPQPSIVEDTAKSATTGLHEGAAGIFGIGGDLQELNAQVGGVGQYWILRASGRSDAEARAEVQRNLDTAREQRRSLNIQLPTSQSVQDAFVAAEPEAVREWTDHTPQTMAGEYARTTGQFASSALAPGSAATRVSRVVVPAAASETAGQLTEGTPLEVPARILAGVGGGIATEVSIAANARRAAERAAQPDAAALEQEFGPMTAGERSGNARARLEEDDMRRGIGSPRAQRTMQAFDDRRTPEVRGNVMRIATRGQEPVSEDLSGAGTTVSDALRTRVDNMREQQGRLYQEAFDLAENERVSANQVATELTDAVDAVIQRDFLDVPAARAVVGRLQGDIARGQATYGTVERARQALNRQLSSALKSGDDNAVYAITSIIDEVDAFVAPRLSPEAGRAITEARGFTREMKNQFGQRQRTELSTGHTGRSDPGGRAIERVLNTDLTGEQVVDAILGAGSKPSQQTLGAVTRIREINDAIAYTNRGAASGVRVPGRIKVGGQTAGERRFAADSDQSRYGVELPNPELQGLREALFHRVLRPLDARNEGGMIPAQTVVTNLRRALDGPGKEITAILFTPREQAAMRRALAYMERLIPPSGAAVSGTSPAISRMVSGTFDKLVGIIPGIGPALREVMENANSTGAARRAIAPASSPRSPSRGPVEQPSPVGPAVVSANSAMSANTNDDRRRP